MKTKKLKRLLKARRKPPVNDFNVGVDPQGNLVIALREQKCTICPFDAMRMAATIVQLMAGHFPAPQPQIITPDRTIVLPNAKAQ